MSMSVEMVLKLIDKFSGPAKTAETEMGNLQKAAERLNEQRGKIRTADWLEQQKALKAATEQAAAYQQQKNKVHAAEKAAVYAGAGALLAKTSSGVWRGAEKAVEEAGSFKRRIQSIATAGGLLGDEKKIGAGVLSTSLATGARWQDIAQGERQLVALGGGEFVDKISGIRERIARLHKASEAELPELYNAIYHYMELNGLSAQKSIEALEKNYLQGRKGAYELKDLAHGIPALSGLAKSYGLTGEQSAIDMPALLQLFRKVTGSPGEADTRLRHILTKLSSPNEADKIKEELGVDVFKTRTDAIAKGANPLLATLEAITNKLDAMGPKAAEKIGAIARDYYFRAGLDAYRQMRPQMRDFMPSGDEARREVDRAYRANITSGGRLEAARDAAYVKWGESFLPLKNWLNNTMAQGFRGVGGFAESHPNLTMPATVGAALGTAAASAFLLKLAAQKGIEALGEGMAKAAAKAAGGAGEVAQPGALSRFLWGGGKAGGLGSSVAHGMFTGLAYAGGKWALDEAENRLLGWSRDSIDNSERNNQLLAHRWWRSKGVNMPWWDGEADPRQALPSFTQPQPTAPTTIPAGRTLPTFAAMQPTGGGEGAAAGAEQTAHPHVDASEIDAAKGKAEEASAAIKALDVSVSTKVDYASIRRGSRAPITRRWPRL
jgi:TP901 family phage tail tape measure protein